MNKQEFAKWAGSKVILLDGATGTNLMLAGMPRGVATEGWIIEHKEVLLELQKGYVKAGSEIIYAPTFAANSISLTKFGLQDKVIELNQKLIAISKEAAGDKAYVAGNITTTGQFLDPIGEMTDEQLLESYKEQIAAQVEAGVDLLVAETMIGVKETVIALDAAAQVCDLPMMCTLTLDINGNSLYGDNAAKAVEILQDRGAVAVGVNCSVGPKQLEAIVISMKSKAKVPIIAKPNAGMPEVNERGEIIYNMAIEPFCEGMKKLVEAGATIIGGCCGTNADYIRGMKQMIDCSKGEIN